MWSCAFLFKTSNRFPFFSIKNKKNPPPKQPKFFTWFTKPGMIWYPFLYLLSLFKNLLLPLSGNISAPTSHVAFLTFHVSPPLEVTIVVVTGLLVGISFSWSFVSRVTNVLNKNTTNTTNMFQATVKKVMIGKFNDSTLLYYKPVFHIELHCLIVYHNIIICLKIYGFDCFLFIYKFKYKTI